MEENRNEEIKYTYVDKVMGVYYVLRPGRDNTWNLFIDATLNGAGALRHTRYDEWGVQHAYRELEEKLRKDFDRNIIIGGSVEPDLVNLTLGEGLKNMDFLMFSNSNKNIYLKSVRFKGYLMLEPNCFQHQDKLESVVWEKLDSDDCYFPCDYQIPYACFLGCKSLKDITIPCSYIEGNAFNSCDNLKRIRYYSENFKDIEIHFESLFTCDAELEKITSKSKARNRRKKGRGNNGI